jgi:hypothetical protein
MIVRVTVYRTSINTNYASPREGWDKDTMKHSYIILPTLQYPNGRPQEKEDLHEETRKLNTEVSPFFSYITDERPGQFYTSSIVLIRAV